MTTDDWSNVISQLSFGWCLLAGLVLFVVAAATFPATPRKHKLALLALLGPPLAHFLFDATFIGLMTDLVASLFDAQFFPVAAIAAAISGLWGYYRVKAGLPINPLLTVPASYTPPSRSQRLFIVLCVTLAPVIVWFLCFTSFSQYDPFLPDGPLAHIDSGFAFLGIFILAGAANYVLSCLRARWEPYSELPVTQEVVQSRMPKRCKGGTLPLGIPITWIANERPHLEVLHRKIHKLARRFIHPIFQNSTLASFGIVAVLGVVLLMLTYVPFPSQPVTNDLNPATAEYERNPTNVETSQLLDDRFTQLRNYLGTINWPAVFTVAAFLYASYRFVTFLIPYRSRPGIFSARFRNRS